MIYLFKNLPQKDIDFSNWNPFIKNEWLRKNYMIFVYILMGFLIILSNILQVFRGRSIWNGLLICFFVFVIHEALHFVTIFGKDDISFTHSGIFFWINTNAVLTKKHFLLFMSLPIIVLSGATWVMSLFVNARMGEILMVVCWFNLIIASSDIINTILIGIKPYNSVFCKGLYIVNTKNKI